MVKKHREKRIKYIQHLLETEKKREEFLEKRKGRKRDREDDEANVDIITQTTVDDTGKKVTTSTAVEAPKVVEDNADRDGRQLKRSRPERKA